MYLGSADLIGPFTEREGCPEGSVVAHRYGGTFNNPQKMVQCRLLPQAPIAPAPASPPPPAPAPVFNVSPVVQTEVSPQISPVFQQTGSGDQSAGTAQIAPGGQSATGSGGGQDMTAFLSYMQAEDRRRREEQAARDAELQRQREREAALERERRIAEENRILAAQEADRAAALRLEQERQLQFTQAQKEMQSREETRAAEIARMAEQMQQAAQAAQANTGGGGGPAFLPPPEQIFNKTELPAEQQAQEKKVPWPLLAVGVALLGAAGYVATRPKKRTRRKNV